MDEQNNKFKNPLVDIIMAMAAMMILYGLISSIASNIFGEYINFVTWMYSRDWGIARILLTTAVVIADVLLIALFVHIFRQIGALHRQPTSIAATDIDVEAHTVTIRDEIRQNMEDIRKLADSPNASDWNMAILRADALLDDVLQHLGHEGPTLAERLKQADPTILKSIERVWSAHRLRNSIAHDPTVQHPREMIIHALRSFETAFMDFGYIIIRKEKDGTPPEAGPTPPAETAFREDLSIPTTQWQDQDADNARRANTFNQEHDG